jgi:hypothetical protein
MSSWQVNKHLDLIVKRLDVLAQPTGTGKAKKKADARVVELLSDVRKIKQELRTKALEVAESLARLEESDRAINWEGVSAGYIEVSRPHRSDHLRAC